MGVQMAHERSEAEACISTSEQNAYLSEKPTAKQILMKTDIKVIDEKG